VVTEIHQVLLVGKCDEPLTQRLSAMAD